LVARANREILIPTEIPFEFWCLVDRFSHLGTAHLARKMAPSHAQQRSSNGASYLSLAESTLKSPPCGRCSHGPARKCQFICPPHTSSSRRSPSPRTRSGAAAAARPPQAQPPWPPAANSITTSGHDLAPPWPPATTRSRTTARGQSPAMARSSTSTSSLARASTTSPAPEPLPWRVAASESLPGRRSGSPTALVQPDEKLPAQRVADGDSIGF
jgi:hypothetical protein